MYKYLLFILLATSCQGQVVKPPPGDGTVKTVTGTTQMEKEFPDEYRAFKKQKDRFEVKECHLYYNGQLVPTYDTAYKAFKIFGNNYSNNEGWVNYYDKPITLICAYLNLSTLENTKDWKENKLPKRTERNTRLLRMRIHFYHKKRNGYSPNDKVNDSLDALIPTVGYMLVEGYPVGKYTDIEKLNEYLKKTGSQPFNETGWRKGGAPTRQYMYGYSKCATELMDQFAVNGKIKDLNGTMFLTFSYSVIDGKKTILYFSYE